MIVVLHENIFFDQTALLSYDFCRQVGLFGFLGTYSL